MSSGLSQLKGLIRNLKKIDTVMQAEISKFIRRESKNLVKLNIVNLLNGIDSKGVPLRFKKNRTTSLNFSKAYTAAYAKLKARRGGQTEHVDLRLFGGFHKSIEIVEVEHGKFVFISTSDIFPYLVANYGEEILGVTEEQMQEFLKGKLKPFLENGLAAKLIPR